MQVFIVEQNLVGISVVMLVVYYRRVGPMMRLRAIMLIHDVIHKPGST